LSPTPNLPPMRRRLEPAKTPHQRRISRRSACFYTHFSWGAFPSQTRSSLVWS
jgi:hypothetical protein